MFCLGDDFDRRREEHSLLPVWSPCACVLMIVVTGLFVTDLILSRIGFAPARQLGVDEHDAEIGDEDRGVPAAARQEVEVVLQFLQFDDLRAVGRGLPGESCTWSDAAPAATSAVSTHTLVIGTFY